MAALLALAAALDCAGSLPRASAVASAPAPAPVAGTIAVAFEGSALLITYYSGVVQALLEKGVIVPGVTPLSGLSGGAFTAVFTTLGLSGEEQKNLWIDIITACGMRFNGSCTGHLNALLDEHLAEVLPDNVTDSVNGLVRIAVSQLNASQPGLNNTATWVLDEWSSKADLRSAMLSTNWIPCFSGGTTYTIYRNQPVIDGGYSAGFRDLCPSGLENCLTVASWHVGDAASQVCDAAKCPSSAASSCTSAERPPEEQVFALYENEGYVDQWPIEEVRQRCPSSLFASMPPYHTGAFVAHNSIAASNVTIDIHPGKFGDLPLFNGTRVIACQWQDWAMLLPSGQELEAMELIYDQGLADGLAWAAAHGF